MTPMQIFKPDSMIDRKELRRKTGITVTKIIELEKAGILPRIEISERNIRYLGDTLNKLFAEKFVSKLK